MKRWSMGCMALSLLATQALAQPGRVSTRCAIDVALVDGQPHIYSRARDILVVVGDRGKGTFYNVNMGHWTVAGKPVPNDTVTVHVGARVQSGLQPDNSCGFVIGQDTNGVFVDESTSFYTHGSGLPIATSDRHYLK